MAADDRRIDWDERYGTSELVWSDRPNLFVAGGLADVEPGTAIDLGAGEGRNSIWLAAHGWQVTAVDFSAAGLAKARRWAVEAGLDERTTFVEANALTWAPETPVDLVLLAYLQLPIEQQVLVLRRAASWVAAGGRLFVVAHDRRNVREGHGGPASEAVCYDVDRTVAAIGRLTVETAVVAERPVDTADGPRTALDTLVVASRPVG